MIVCLIATLYPEEPMRNCKKEVPLGTDLCLALAPRGWREASSSSPHSSVLPTLPTFKSPLNNYFINSCSLIKIEANTSLGSQPLARLSIAYDSKTLWTDDVKLLLEKHKSNIFDGKYEWNSEKDLDMRFGLSEKGHKYVTFTRPPEYSIQDMRHSIGEALYQECWKIFEKDKDQHFCDLEKRVSQHLRTKRPEPENNQLWWLRRFHRNNLKNNFAFSFKSKDPKGSPDKVTLVVKKSLEKDEWEVSLFLPSFTGTSVLSKITKNHVSLEKAIDECVETFQEKVTTKIEEYYDITRELYDAVKMFKKETL